MRACAASSLLILGLMGFFLLWESGPFWAHFSLGSFFLGRAWRPTSDPPAFGALPLIGGTLMVSAVALFVAGALGLALALMTSEVLPKRARDPVKTMLEILAGIPSVIYGFFGMTILGPWIQEKLFLPSGQTALTAGLVLGIMALPTVASVAEDAVSAVPNGLREASAALGASRWQSMWRAVLPAARSGILAALLLGLGRAAGETMAVVMISGNSPIWPPRILSPVRTITGTLALEMGETPVGSMHYRALFALSLVLFLFTLGINTAGELISRRVRRWG